ncbi:hypothetical protein [Defluviitalea phaphyphila]|uniref:hypothetical protein n=1 Tax=Defluviitalea phaphyphila TaxID=1473580 RepID=UPI000731850F|nr:hypothetical protein [Defluviitalea phaphyphila]
MDIIEQTNRTILFDCINPEKLDLLTLVGDVRGLESLDDDKIKEINEHLLVSSFDEFLDKFQPVIYSFFNAANQKVVYTLNKPTGIPEDCIQEIPIDRNNDFLKMLLTMIQTKRSQGIENVDFAFDKILDMISPKKVMDDIKAIRKEIHYLYEKYEKLDDEDPLKLDIGDKLNVKFEEASKSYNNIMAMLPLAIEDSKQRLLAGRTSESDDGEKFVAGQLTMGDDGELKIIERPKTESTELVVAEEQTTNALAEIFKEDYENITEEPSDYVAELVVRTFCPLPVTNTEELDIQKEVEKYNSYLEFYQTSKSDFIKVAKPLIEKILGVFIFFDQYQSKNKGMAPTMLITNNTLSMLTKSSNLPILQVYLNTVNNKNDFRNTIWFGIVGDIEFNKGNNIKLTRERFKGNKKVVKEDINTMESLTSLLHGICDYKIQTFFSFETCEETSFTAVATKGIDEYIERTNVLTRKEYSEYAICCLPNLSIVPKNKSGVILDSYMVATEEGAKISKEKKDLLKLWIEGVYIPASYLAAGITAAYQCPEFLRTRFKNVIRDYPGVRFDIEASNHALKVPTTLAKEISGYTNKIKDSINSRNFGFVFSSDNHQIDGKELRQITVYKARSMQLVDNEYESIYKTLTATYISRIMRAQTSDYKHDNVVFFFSTNPQSQRSLWFSNQGAVNSIIMPGDDISYNIEEEYNICNIDLSFNGNTKNLEIVLNKNTKVS